MLVRGGLPLPTPKSAWILKHYESESVYASDFGWSRKVFLDHPPNQNIYYVNVDGLGGPSETIQNLILVHKLIRIHSMFYSQIR